MDTPKPTAAAVVTRPQRMDVLVVAMTSLAAVEILQDWIRTSHRTTKVDLRTSGVNCTNCGARWTTTKEDSLHYNCQQVEGGNGACERPA